jgi:hypothetical protein
MALPDRHPTVRTLTPRGDTIRVAQITDTHLKAFAGGKLLGLDTDYSLQAVVDLVRREFPRRICSWGPETSRTAASPMPTGACRPILTR